MNEVGAVITAIVTEMRKLRYTEVMSLVEGHNGSKDLGYAPGSQAPEPSPLPLDTVIGILRCMN